jgi:adenosine kinase
MNKKSLLGMTRTLIVTLGAQGSRVATPDGEINIATVTPRQVKDPTGAGDAYRGGLLSGLAKGMDIEHCARVGSVCASFAVECYGTQEYTFSPLEFSERFDCCY